MVFFKELCISLTPSDFIGVSIISIIQLLAETRAYVCMSGHATDYILDLAYKLILSWTIKLNLSFRYPNCHSKVRTINIVESTLKKLHHNICPAYFRKISLFSLLPHNQSPMQSCRSLQFPPKSILLVKGGHCVRECQSLMRFPKSLGPTVFVIKPYLCTCHWNVALFIC